MLRLNLLVDSPAAAEESASTRDVNPKLGWAEGFYRGYFELNSRQGEAEAWYMLWVPDCGAARVTRVYCCTLLLEFPTIRSLMKNQESPIL
jgi:hypothetical protein